MAGALSLRMISSSRVAAAGVVYRWWCVCMGERGAGEPARLTCRPPSSGPSAPARCGGACSTHPAGGGQGVRAGCRRRARGRRRPARAEQRGSPPPPSAGLTSLENPSSSAACASLAARCPASLAWESSCAVARGEGGGGRGRQASSPAGSGAGTAESTRTGAAPRWPCWPRPWRRAGPGRRPRQPPGPCSRPCAARSAAAAGFAGLGVCSCGTPPRVHVWRARGKLRCIAVCGSHLRGGARREGAGLPGGRGPGGRGQAHAGGAGAGEGHGCRLVGGGWRVRRGPTTRKQTVFERLRHGPRYDPSWLYRYRFSLSKFKS